LLIICLVVVRQNHLHLKKILVQRWYQDHHTMVLNLADLFNVTTDYLLRDAIPIDDASPATDSPD